MGKIVESARRRRVPIRRNRRNQSGPARVPSSPRTQASTPTSPWPWAAPAAGRTGLGVVGESFLGLGRMGHPAPDLHPGAPVHSRVLGGPSPGADLRLPGGRGRPGDGDAESARSTEASTSFPARPWLIFCGVWLLLLVHPNSYSIPAAVGRSCCTSRCSRPAFWAGEALESPRQLNRIMAVLFLCNCPERRGGRGAGPSPSGSTRR